MPLNSSASRGFQDKCTLVEEMEEQLREVGEELGTKIYIWWNSPKRMELDCPICGKTIEERNII